MSIREFVNKQISSKNKKNIKLGSKNILIRYFWAAILKKNYSQIFNQHSRICETFKISSKTKKISLGPKMLYLGFWAGMLSNWQSTPSNLSNSKFLAKTRILKFGTKKCLIWMFGVAVLKNNCHIWNQHPRILQRFVQKNKNPYIWDDKRQICVFWD